MQERTVSIVPFSPRSGKPARKILGSELILSKQEILKIGVGVAAQERRSHSGLVIITPA